MDSTLKDRLIGIRLQLNDIWAEVDKLHDDVIGKWTTRIAVDDALDDVDRAIQSAPRVNGN